MAFNVKLELIIGEENILISDLNIEFRIERSIRYSENFAEFTIYNAKETTVKKISKNESDLTFKFGYVDEIKGNEDISVLFFGNVIDPVTNIDGSNKITKLKSVLMKSSKLKRRLKQVSFSYVPDTLLSSVIKDIGNMLGIVVWGAENAEIQLLNGFTYIGSTRGALLYCKKILEKERKSLYIDNTEIVIYSLDSRTSKYSTIYLDYESGLISVDDITDYADPDRPDDKRIEFQSLIIPKMQTNGLLTIKNTNKHEGTYLIEKMILEGNNFGGQNICKGEAIL